MQTSPVRLIDYFDGRKQSIIPLFQRPYSWQKGNWDTLWQDILDCANPDGTLSHHFMGAIVSLSVTTTPIGVNKHFIIDGQQRLTTISLLLCAIREFLDERTRERLQDFLINRHDEGIEKFKVAPTHADRDTYDCIVNEKRPPSPEPLIYKAYAYFKTKLKMSKENDGIDPIKILDIIESALRVVMISLDPEQEDPYEIFESLNFKGTDLTPADLVRNFILMKYRHSLGDNGDQTRIYREYWSPIEKNCEKELPQFIMHYCRLNGREVRKRNIYPAFKGLVDQLNPQAMENQLNIMLSLSSIYPRFLNPDLESDLRVSQSLRLLKVLGVTVFYPILMRLYAAKTAETVSQAELQNSLHVLESYLIRRSVCNLKNNALDSMTIQLLKDWDATDIVSYLQRVLTAQTGNLRWPRDEEFTASFVNDPQYGRKSTNYVLRCLEDSFGHKEAVKADTSEIEHILPQTLTDEWRNALSSEDAGVVDKFVDTYGNLTLTGYNGELGNKPFAYKREIYAKSNYELSKVLAKSPIWGIQEIRGRGEYLAKVAARIWNGPNSENLSSTESASSPA